MLTETIQLETLRQKIEDLEYEAGSQSDYLDRGNPNASQATQAQAKIDKMNSQSQALKAELKELIATVRSQQPQAIEEWVNDHVGILQKIAEEKTTGTMAAVRRNVAKTTIQEWENVRAGKQDYVNINWHYLKDYREARKIGRKAPTRSGSRTEERPNNDGKVWWQFWK
jgi:predicted Ser/Thr protein kinase